jgi:hypothetical protein
MTKASEIRALRPGRYLSRKEMQSLLGDLPPQTEFSLDIRDGPWRQRKSFRRWQADGREAWEVVGEW